MEVWETIRSIGELCKDIDLVVSVEPILFACVEKKSKRKYLVMTLDSAEGKYVIIEVSSKGLLAMLRNEVTMEQTFRNAKIIYMTEYDQTDNIVAYGYNSLTFDENKLPQKGAYFNIESEYINKYIRNIIAE